MNTETGSGLIDEAMGGGQSGPSVARTSPRHSSTPASGDGRWRPRAAVLHLQAAVSPSRDLDLAV